MNYTCEYDLAQKLYRRFNYMKDHFPDDNISDVTMTFTKEEFSGIDSKILKGCIRQIFKVNVLINIDEYMGGQGRVTVSICSEV